MEQRRRVQPWVTVPWQLTRLQQASCWVERDSQAQWRGQRCLWGHLEQCCYGDIHTARDTIYTTQPPDTGATRHQWLLST